MASFSFPTSIFESFEIHLPCSITGAVSLSPRHHAGAVVLQTNIHGGSIDERSVDSSVHISSFQKNGNKIWRIHFSSSEELVEADARELHEATSSSRQDKALSDSQYCQAASNSHSISSDEVVMDDSSWNSIQEMLSTAQMTQPTFGFTDNQEPNGLFDTLDLLPRSNVLTELSSYSESSDHALSELLQHRELREDSQLSTFSPSSMSSPGTLTSEDEDSHPPAQDTLFHCTEPNCSKTFKRAHSRNGHVKRCHTNVGTSRNVSTTRTHRCTAPNCGEQFTRSHDRMRHEFSQHGICTHFLCSKCHRVFGSPSKLERHDLDKHPTPN
ncbi:hypothetical protein GALMADRAFT_135561 [Galerina marginata CBS 339.88]|uniref:C2H2-type domain-containing protein n=1 Tax=Galerina marginata (strain CBS 339.88) TaxID=685588 RepID=A0A067TIL3_GALM3|nr:hypothetical protein GALMADRAFT_135561 [Galerina marginata CBS 339.88]